MMPRSSHLNMGLAALSVFSYLMASQADAQASGNGRSTAQDIWRHLPGHVSDFVPDPEPAPKRRPSRIDQPVVAVATRPSPTADAAAKPARDLGQARVVIHYRRRGGYERSQQLVRLLRAAGTAEVEIREVRYAVETQSIRYFRSADRDVSETIGGIIGGNSRASVSDFSHFRPTPRAGTVEIWLP